MVSAQSSRSLCDTPATANIRGMNSTNVVTAESICGGVRTEDSFASQRGTRSWPKAEQEKRSLEDELSGALPQAAKNTRSIAEAIEIKSQAFCRIAARHKDHAVLPIPPQLPRQN